MNNPFLSDRNIFSKVVNPLKKKEDTKQQGPAPVSLNPAPPDRSSQGIDRVNKQISSSNTAQTYNPNRNRFQQPPAAKPSPFTSQTQKMTFGIPNNDPESGQNIDRQYFGNPRPQAYEQQQSQSEAHEIYNYKKNDSIQFPSSTGKALGGDVRTFPTRTAEVMSPPQDYKFQEFRKNNQLADCSPINPQPRMGDSQFLNIDALGDDLNRFLAESKNQEELCKILGIQRNNKAPIQKPSEFKGKGANERFERRGAYQRVERQEYSAAGSKGMNDPTDSRGFNERAQNKKFNQRIENSRNSEFKEDYNRSNSNNLRNPFQKMETAPTRNNQLPSQPQQQILPKAPTIFSKDRKVQNGRTDPYVAPTKAQEPPRDHVPTFNFGGLDQEHSTISREDDEAPNFSTVQRAKVRSGQASKASQESEVQPLQVFNYSNAAVDSRESVEQSIRREMMELSINGRYRTFLSASEKITTVKYRMDVL